MASSINPNSNLEFRNSDVCVGGVIALAMAALFTVASSGWSLIVTFVTGVCFSFGLLLWMWRRRLPLPEATRVLPFYFFALALQFLHFFEEFHTGFYIRFPAIYGGTAYSEQLFVGFNMAAYAVFTVTAVLAYFRRIRAAVLPTLFFSVYGVMGNAIAHPFWAVDQRGYFPGLFTALGFWVVGPPLVNQFLRNRKHTAIFITLFAGVLILVLKVSRRGG